MMFVWKDKKIRKEAEDVPFFFLYSFLGNFAAAKFRGGQRVWLLFRQSEFESSQNLQFYCTLD